MTVDVPVVAVELAVKVSTLLPVVGFVPKLAVTPLGRAEVESVTDPVNPPLGVTVMVELALLPWVTLTLEGEADNEKFARTCACTPSCHIRGQHIQIEQPEVVTRANRDVLGDIQP